MRLSCYYQRQPTCVAVHPNKKPGLYAGVGASFHTLMVRSGAKRRVSNHGPQTLLLVHCSSRAPTLESDAHTLEGPATDADGRIGACGPCFETAHASRLLPTCAV